MKSKKPETGIVQKHLKITHTHTDTVTNGHEHDVEILINPHKFHNKYRTPKTPVR